MLQKLEKQNEAKQRVPSRAKQNNAILSVSKRLKSLYPITIPPKRFKTILAVLRGDTNEFKLNINYTTQ